MRARIQVYDFYLRMMLHIVPLISFSFATYISFYAFASGERTFRSPDWTYAIALVITTLIWMAACEKYKLTNTPELFRAQTTLGTTAVACGMTYTAVAAISYLSHRGAFISRVFVITSAVTLIVVTTFVRVGFRWLVARHGYMRWRSKILVFGADAYAMSLAAAVEKNPLWAARVVGFVKLPGQDSVVPTSVAIEEVGSYAINAEIDEAVLAVAPEKLGELPMLLPVVQKLSVPVRLALNLAPELSIRQDLYQIDEFHVLDVQSTPAESVKYLIVKRIFDVAFSAAVIVAGAPLLLLIAALVRMSSRGPVLFRQERVGLNGRTFTMYKFRTMKVGDTQESETRWTVENDPRRTAIGSFLRKTSLDELPQFFNVLRGHMSVVGPRPERPHFVKQFFLDYRRYNQRHRLKAGITGLAQVQGFRGDTPIDKRLECDLAYLRNWSFMLDLKIIGMTVFSGLLNKNAY